MSSALKVIKRKYAEQLAEVVGERDQMQSLLAAAVMRAGGEIRLGSATVHAALGGVEILVSNDGEGGLLLQIDSKVQA